MALYGVLYAILENDIRRLLSYHIISQVGFMVTAVGIGTVEAINGAVAHAFAHILYKGLLLMGVGAVLFATGRSKASALGRLGGKLRTTLVLYMVGAVSISSVPLFSGFVSKELIVEAAYQSELAWLVIGLKVVSVGTWLSTGLKLPYATWFGAKGPEPAPEPPRLTLAAIPTSMYVAMWSAAAINLLLGLAPGLLYALMPAEVVFDPYTAGKVIEKIQILTFTGLGYALLIGLLPSKPLISLDTDWVYRGLPGRLRDAMGRRRAAQAPAERPATPSPATPSDAVPEPARGSTGRAPTVLLTRVFQPSEGPPDVPATWVLGAIILLASLVLLTSSLLW
jgi:multicomponent Na+:H+ antiporter subunit D